MTSSPAVPNKKGTRAPKKKAAKTTTTINVTIPVMVNRRKIDETEVLTIATFDDAVVVAE